MALVAKSVQRFAVFDNDTLVHASIPLVLMRGREGVRAVASHSSILTLAAFRCSAEKKEAGFLVTTSRP